MKLNAIEKGLMNNPVRSGLQRHYEGRLLERLGGRAEGERVLEVGCGRGVGTEIVLDRFGAAEVTAFDLDPDMVERARRRLAPRGDRARLYVASATEIPEPDASFDAVFDFGIVHHIPEWRDAVAEIVRVLKPGGRFYFEEVTRHALDRWSYRTFLEHPEEDRFNGTEWIAELERQGIEVAGNYVHRFFGDFVIGVGRRASS